jgi:hypothetical protein
MGRRCVLIYSTLNAECSFKQAEYPTTARINASMILAGRPVHLSPSRLPWLASSMGPAAANRIRIYGIRSTGGSVISRSCGGDAGALMFQDGRLPRIKLSFFWSHGGCLIIFFLTGWLPSFSCFY